MTNNTTIGKCLGCMEDKNPTEKVCPLCGYTEGTPPKEIYHITPGTILHGKYIVGRVLGYGGFGITYIGWDPTLNRKVAIKEFLPGDFATRMPGETLVTVYNGEATKQFEAGLERFIEEARRLAKFNSVGSIVDIYDTFIENNTGYIVMQCLEGDTVKEFIKQNGLMPYESARLIIIEILKTLSVVHKEGIIHRDISPDNIFITNDNKVKLLDFGAARYASGFHSKSLSVMLKPGYAPEEQYRSRGNQGPWSDVYATAATLYKMITGITIEESIERTVKDSIKSPAELGVKIPEGANNAIMNALNIHAEKRTQSAEEFINELESEFVKRVVDKPNKTDSGKLPSAVKISAAIVLGVAMVLLVLLWTNVINIFDNSGTELIADSSARVPYVINQSKDEGEKLLLESGFAMQIVDQAYDENAEKDIIKSQSPNGGQFGRDCTVSEENGKPVIFVVVSGGHAPVLVPSVNGKNKDEAKATLSQLGFEPKIKEIYSPNIPAGTVIIQDIENLEYAYGSEIIVTVSAGEMNFNGEKKAEMPDVSGMKFDDAYKALSEAGFYVEICEKTSSDEPGKVLAQSIAPGELTACGTVVTLDISTTVTVIPDVTYKAEGTAKSMIEETGATVKLVYEANSKIAKGSVIRQDITGKTTPGATVTLTVSSGSPKSSYKSPSGGGSGSVQQPSTGGNNAGGGISEEERIRRELEASRKAMEYFSGNSNQPWMVQGTPPA